MRTPPHPFGGVRTATGALPTARFPGQWFQSESGLHQNWMRDYDPTTGRYIQADPLGLIDGASVYGYVRQNPGRFIDPRGECPWCFAGAAALLVAILTPEPANAPGLCDEILPLENWKPYAYGAGAGIAIGQVARYAYYGYEIILGKNVRIAVFGNRTGNQYGKWPHYHRRGSAPGQGVGRHRPWEKRVLINLSGTGSSYDIHVGRVSQ